ncbi:related to PCH2-Putative ATPase [Zygosaccharomyces bailii ISA1307]|nr:related to PCH2-Putative ATPase [Zygosaccharomyces bailii ISA1307]
MVYMIDAHVRGSTVQLVRRALKEEVKEEVELQKRSQGDSFEGSSAALRSKMRTFYTILRNVISRRMAKYSEKKLENMVLLSDTLLSEGHGSIEVRDPPTVAQERIIKSLVKVVFHQMSISKSDQVDPGQANLLLSLFVNKIYCDRFVESSSISHPQGRLKDAVSAVMASSNPSETYTKRTPADKTFSVYLFCCLEDVPDFQEGSLLTEEFDKIDLDGDEDLEGDTLTASTVSPSVLHRLPFSKQTFSQTRITLLPSNELEGLWESLYFDDRIKQRMYSYATIALKIANFVDLAQSGAHAFANNKLLLVQGPPGTGKTTVCKALCQKLSIRREFSPEADPLSNSYKGIVIEISCSRIFSRWFGESSKNLTGIFADVENLLKLHQGDCTFVCLLIDEVEAIAFSRNNLLNKNESTDGVRVVSTLLTQLDLLKKYNNLLVLATSNLIDSLDPAFLDRADGVFYIGNPSATGIAKILASSLDDLILKKVISTDAVKNIMDVDVYKEALVHIAEKCSVCWL